MNDNDQQERFRTFLRHVETLRSQEHESTHWEKAIDDFCIHDLEKYGQEKEIPHHVARSEFGFRFVNSVRTAFDSLLANIVIAISHLLLLVSHPHRKAHEHARAIAFLKRRGQFEAYRTFIRSLNIGSDMQTIRHFHYAHTLKHEVKKRDAAFLNRWYLEIGAGAGNFAIMCFRLFKPQRYFIVDLPQMLAYAAFQIMKHVPQATIVYPHEFNARTIEHNPMPAVYLLTPNQISEVPEKSIGIICNLTSFSEMDRDEIKRYFDEIYRAGSLGAFFYDVNRRKEMRDRRGGRYVNNPFHFPYRDDDEILFWTLDKFHHETRSGLGIIPTLTVAHMSRMR